MSTFRRHWPNEISMVGTLVSFGFLLYALLHPMKSFDFFEIWLAASMLGFFFFMKKAL